MLKFLALWRLQKVFCKHQVFILKSSSKTLVKFYTPSCNNCSSFYFLIYITEYLSPINFSVKSDVESARSLQYLVWWISIFIYMYLIWILSVLLSIFFNIYVTSLLQNIAPSFPYLFQLLLLHYTPYLLYIYQLLLFIEVFMMNLCFYISLICL